MTAQAYSQVGEKIPCPPFYLFEVKKIPISLMIEYQALPAWMLILGLPYTSV